YFKDKKIYFSMGGNISTAEHTRKDLKGDSSLSYKFVNLFPNANLQVYLEGGARISMYYYGYTQPPSIDQIQPVRDNTDLLNQRIGNPDLKQSFRHRISGS